MTSDKGNRKGGEKMRDIRYKALEILGEQMERMAEINKEEQQPEHIRANIECMVAIYEAMAKNDH